MTNAPAIRRAVSRAAANLVAVAAITAIFGFKAYFDRSAGFHAAPASAAEIAAYDGYLTEQP